MRTCVFGIAIPTMTAAVRGLRGNELFVRLVELDPELVLPYLLDRRGRSQDAILGLVQVQVVGGQADGSIRAGNPTDISRGLLLAAQGFVLSASTMLGEGVGRDDLDAELATLLTRSLLP